MKKKRKRRKPILSTNTEYQSGVLPEKTPPHPDIDGIRRLIIQSEIHFSKHFAETVEKPYGIIYHNAENPDCCGSNHAVILNLATDIDAGLKDIIRFYRKRKIDPCLFQAFQDSETEALFPHLQKNGFTIEQYRHTPFLLNESGPQPPLPYRTDLDVRPIEEIDKRLGNAIFETDESDRNIKKFCRQLKDDNFRLLVGKNTGGEPVTMAALYIADNISRLDDVVTFRDHRNNGYATDLVNKTIAYHREHSGNPLFLFAEDQTAIRIYEKLGFEKIEFPYPFWGAYRIT
jgi:GNAT superfamily N-acetyltransferase